MLKAVIDPTDRNRNRDAQRPRSPAVVLEDLSSSLCKGPDFVVVLGFGLGLGVVVALGDGLQGKGCPLPLHIHVEKN